MPIRPWAWLIALTIVAACSPSNQPQALEPVAALPKPNLPSWIAQVSPVGSAQSLAQIRVIFAKPVTAVASLSGDGPKDVLSHLSITPALRGRFVMLTPRMAGFVADQALPLGTRARVTISAGLRDLDGDTLANDLSWTFHTDALAFTSLPQPQASPGDPTPAPVGPTPLVSIQANAAADVASLSQHASFVSGDDRIPATATLVTPSASPLPGSTADAAFDPSQNTWNYTLIPQRPLKLGTTYALQIAPGVAPAYGNVPTARDFRGSITTYGPLAIVPSPVPSSSPSAARFANGDPEIDFTNQLDPASVAGAVSIAPSPASVKNLIQVPAQSGSIVIDPYALSPNSTYKVTIGPNVKDVWGQTLGASKTVTVTTGDFLAGSYAPTGTNVIPAGSAVAVNFYATNLPGNQYRSASATVAPDRLFGYVDPSTLLPKPAAWPLQTISDARTNAQSVVKLDLDRIAGGQYGLIAYGFLGGRTADDATPNYTGIVELTDLGVFAQWFPQHGIVRVQHLHDGSPASGVTLTLYRLDLDNNIKQSCATGTTDAGGSFDLQGDAVASCYALAKAGQAPALGVVAREGNDTAVLTTNAYDGVGNFPVNAGWVGGAPYSLGTIFTDRTLYQPGERGSIFGVAYYAKGGAIVADANASYAVRLTDPSGQSVSLGSVKTDAHGLFMLPLQLGKNQALGYYSLAAKGTNGNEIDGQLRVATFKPPNFKVTLDISATAAPAGGSVNATASAQYLFGAPLQGGTAHATVTREIAAVQPKGWDDYSFGPQWFWPDSPPEYTSDVSQSDLALDAQGNARFTVPVPADLPFPMTYLVDVETSDVSNLSVATSQSFLALPSDAVIGLSSDVVGTAGTAMPVKTIVTDAAGGVVAGRSVHLELQKMTYTSATQQVEGGDSADEAVQYTTVSQADVTSGAAPVVASLTPSDPGPYRVVATFAGTSGTASATDIQVYVQGSGSVDWGGSPQTVPVELDKKTYRAGDTATALVASPFDHADVYVSVVRNDVLYSTVLRNASGSPKVRIPVQASMLPNAAVEAVVVRRGPNVATLKPGALTSLVRFGMTPLNVDLSDRYLKLAIEPQSPKVQPGGKQHVTIRLTRSGGGAAPGEIAAVVVDDAILQLSGYRLPDLVQTVFAQQPISTIFSDNRSNVLLQTPAAPLEKGFGYGGGYLGGAASTRVRAIFLPMAYSGIMSTASDGTASFDLTLPDNLTTWRVMAVAIGDDNMHFASGDATFIASQPLITNPLLPQFARPGDRFDLGVSVNDQTGAAGALDLVLQLTGALTFASGDARSAQMHEQATTGMQAYRSTVAVGTPAPTTVTAKTTLGSQSDAFSVPFTVSDRAITDATIETGATAATASVPIALDRGGALSITLTNSVVPSFAVPVSRAMAAGDVSLADDAASRLTVASVMTALQQPYALKLGFDPVKERDTQLTRLLGFQRDDGGFGYFAGARSSDPWLTAAALDALAVAGAHGASVPAGALSKATTFASQALANPARFGACGTSDACKAELRFDLLWALAQTGDRRTDFLQQIVAQSTAFDAATAIRLARYLLATPGWQSQGAALADRMQQQLYVTGRFATANVSQPWYFFGSAAAAQAQMLQLLVERHAPVEQLDGAVRALVNQSCNCGWPTLADTAEASLALASYARVEPIVASSVAVTQNGKQLAHASFGSTPSAQQVALAASSLAKAPLQIAASGGGSVHYTLLYVYPVPRNAPGELAAFRVIRTVAPPGTGSTAVATMDLDPVAAVTLASAKVFDIGVRVVVDHPVDRLLIDDPLPAGLEAVDATFATTSTATVAQSDSWQIDSQEIDRDRVVAYAQHLGPGVYEIHYLARSVTPGTFAWPGASASLRGAPEQFGRSAATTLTITP